jgi:transposase
MKKAGRPKGSGKELEARRMKAAKMLERGIPPVDVAKKLGVSQAAVSQWQKAIREKGSAKGLKSKGKPGPRPVLTASVMEKSRRALLKGPRANGLDTDLWTLESAGQVVAKISKRKFSHQRIWLLLRRDIQWTPQKPKRQASQRDDAAIEQWRKKSWARIKKKPENAVQS